MPSFLPSRYTILTPVRGGRRLAFNSLSGSREAAGWKCNIEERLLIRAQAMGAVTTDDDDPAEVRTDPAELCNGSRPWGQEISEPMRAYYPKPKNILSQS